ncbi:MAG: hypothetical protein JO100_16910 [Pseudonocardia sp.]|nr:hypothetical protein [Pseudonocardia sp.]
MLKKAGIILAVASASLLAASPQAFAGEYSEGCDHDRGHHHSCDEDRGDRDHDGGREHRDRDHGGGLIGVNDNNIQAPLQLCGNNILSGVLGILAEGQENDSRNRTHCNQENKIH